ncbi:MAG: Maf-like protein YceF [bacterium ADurb.Bin400]|nr:MAG: Maf-like protein YceF [bacterium ADurb.Bin400]
MSKIILATTSPYRQQAFKFLDLDFVAEGSDVDEYFSGRPSDPKVLVKLLAKMKAESVASRFDSGIVIGFDSVGCYNGQILEKPKSKQEAFDRLVMLSGNSHDFHTGLCLINLDTDQAISDIVSTKLYVRNLNKPEIEKYLSQDKRYNTYALGYDPLEHYSSTFIDRIEGSYNNFTRGIPLERIVELLSRIGYTVR